ncbi:hypothetical protein F5B20DRAFT_555471 [Whalleya microplaca]|nr:hypothetical protein F5B20DRAFT_555471 [Whalleya microplaca]
MGLARYLWSIVSLGFIYHIISGGVWDSWGSIELATVIYIYIKLKKKGAVYIVVCVYICVERSQVSRLYILILVALVLRGMNLWHG